MQRIGTPPYLDTSLGGDRRFNPTYAEVGKNAIRYHLLGTAAENNIKAHEALWLQYLADKPELQSILMRSTGIEDWHCKPDQVSHVKALWRVRQHLIDEIDL